MSGKRLIAGLVLLMALGGTLWSEDKKPSKADEEAETLKGLRKNGRSKPNSSRSKPN